jgi:hypothetical protein
MLPERVLAYFRIALGLTMMVETIQIWDSLADLYGPYGFLEAALMNAVAGRSAPSYAAYFEQRGWSYPQLLSALFWLRWIFLATFTLGLFTRLSTFALWLLQTFILASGALSSYGLDRYFHMFTFLQIWMPAGRELSLDRWRAALPAGPAPGARLSLRVLQFALLITYLNAGIAKAQGEEWWSGDAVWRVLHMPEFQRASFLWMADHAWLPKLLCWSTLFLETFYIVGVWVPRVGTLWVAAIVGMHLGIASFMNLVSFGIALALFNVILFAIPRSGALEDPVMAQGIRVLSKKSVLRAEKSVFRPVLKGDPLGLGGEHVAQSPSPLSAGNHLVERHGHPAGDSDRYHPHAPASLAQERGEKFGLER